MEPVHKEIIQTSDDSHYIVLKQLDKLEVSCSKCLLD